MRCCLKPGFDIGYRLIRFAVDYVRVLWLSSQHQRPEESGLKQKQDGAAVSVRIGADIGCYGSLYFTPVQVQRNTNMFIRYDTIGEFNIDWKAEY